MKKRICSIFNYAPHYREDIYLLMDKNFDCEFYFGNSTYSKIKKLDYSKFNKPAAELEFKKLLAKFYILKGQSKISYNEFDYFIITGQMYSISDWWLLIRNKLKKKKTFIWNHGLYGNENILSKTLKKLQSYLIHGYFLYGNLAKQEMIKHGYNANKLHVIYNSLHYSRSTLIRPKLAKTKIYSKYFNNEYPTLIFIGRLTKVKKLNILLDAQRKSLETGNAYNCVIIGDGDEKNRLEKYVIENKLSDSVWFYGACYDEEKIAELIYNADICVSPGNIGLTAIHSLSYGTPAITHNNFYNQMPEFESIKTGITGNFFDENNSASLQKCIDEWLSKFPVKSKEVVENCYSVVDSFYNPFYQIEVIKKALK